MKTIRKVKTRKYNFCTIFITAVFYFFMFQSHAFAQDYWYVLIDAGHGGTDPGAPGVCGVPEKDLTLGYSNQVWTEILGDLSPWYPYRTRNSDVTLTPEQRYNMANNTTGTEVDADNDPIPQDGVDAFISIHCNASDGTASGTEVYYYEEALDPDPVLPENRPPGHNEAQRRDRS